MDFTKYQTYLDKAKAAIAEGFTSKAAQKQCTSHLNRAYEGLCDTFRNEISDLYETNSEGSRTECVANQKIWDLVWSIPMDLHHYREKHAKAILSLKSELKDVTDKMEALFSLRKEVLAMELKPKKTQAELKLEEARSLQTPVALAVRPLREDAIKQAKQFAMDRIKSVHKILDEAEWDLRKVDESAKTACQMITDAVPEHELDSRIKYKFGRLRLASAQAEERFIDRAATFAAENYDMFVYKLNEKAGPHKAASLEGEHVWGDSYLTVETESGEVDIWHTKMIINHSKHGLAFNQFPTRKIKK